MATEALKGEAGGRKAWEGALPGRRESGDRVKGTLAMLSVTLQFRRT